MQYNEITESSQKKREPIGHVTKGGYSYVRGCGYGVGLCSIFRLREIIQNTPR